VKVIALLGYMVILVFAGWITWAFSKTVFSGDQVPGVDVLLVFFIDPIFFMVFIASAFVFQYKFNRVSIRLIGEVLLAGFLLQLSMGLHGVQNWSLFVGVLFLVACLVFIRVEVRHLKLK
jgi:hypothetical protein